MTANAQPIFSKVGDIQWILLATANTTADLTSGTIGLVFQADPTNGGFLREIRVKAVPGANTVATAIRIWINNGLTNGTAANNSLIDEATWAATTASSTAGLVLVVIPMNLALPPGYRVYATIATYSTGTLHFTGVGGKY